LKRRQADKFCFANQASQQNFFRQGKSIFVFGFAKESSMRITEEILLESFSPGS